MTDERLRRSLSLVDAAGSTQPRVRRGPSRPPDCGPRVRRQTTADGRAAPSARPAGQAPRPRRVAGRGRAARACAPCVATRAAGTNARRAASTAEQLALVQRDRHCPRHSRAHCPVRPCRLRRHRRVEPSAGQPAEQRIGPLRVGGHGRLPATAVAAARPFQRGVVAGRSGPAIRCGLASGWRTARLYRLRRGPAQVASADLGDGCGGSGAHPPFRRLRPPDLRGRVRAVVLARWHPSCVRPHPGSRRGRGGVGRRDTRPGDRCRERAGCHQPATQRCGESPSTLVA